MNKGKTLFIIHSYVDFTFFLPLILLFKKYYLGFDILFLGKEPKEISEDIYFKIYHENILSMDEPTQFILKNQAVSSSNKYIKKLLNIIYNYKCSPKLFKDVSYNLIITDQSLNKYNPMCKMKLLKYLRKVNKSLKVISFVHSITIYKEMQDKNRIKYYNSLIKYFEYIIYGDDSFDRLLKETNVKHIKLPALKYSNYFMEFLKEYIVDNSQIMYNKKIKSYKKKLVFFDGVFEHDELKASEIRLSIIDSIKLNWDCLFIFKIKPRDFKSIILEIEEYNFKNVLFIFKEYSTEELSIIADYVVLAKASASIFFPLYLNTRTAILNSYSNKEIYFDDIKIDNINEIFDNNIKRPKNYCEYINQNKLDINEEEILSIYQELIRNERSL